MYSIALDKNKVFECNASIEGASTDNSKVRLVVETKDYNIVLTGTIDSNGSVKIPIPKLKNTLKEGLKGDISLEVVVDDTLFTPWTDEYLTEVMQKVEVSFTANPNTPILEEKKVKVEVKPTGIKGLMSSITPVNILASALLKEGVTMANVTAGTPEANKTIVKFIKEYKINTTEYKKILQNLPTVLK